MELPQGYEEARQAAWDRLPGVHGHLSDKEVDFLFLLGAARTAPGAVLEIGSYMGRSTVILAAAARLAGDQQVVAVDPLTSPAPTDPDLAGAESVEPEFRRNLEQAGVADRVEFHKAFSEELSPDWDRPLRVLWIDGDHTLEGARRDMRGFAPHLADGGIVAMHDVLHRRPGPMRVFMEEVLLSERFGACGIVGSIGWAQCRHDPQDALRHREEKLKLWKQLARVLPLAVFKDRSSRIDRKLWKLRRNFVPHGAADPAAWCKRVAAAATAGV